MLVLMLTGLLFGGQLFGALGSGFAPNAVADSGTVRQTRTVGAFDSIDAGGAFELVIDADESSTSVVVEAAPDIAGKITTVVHGRTLKIDEERGPIDIDSRRTVVTIGAASLKSLTLNGAIGARVTDLHGPAFDLDVSGTGNAKLAGTVNAFSLSVSGAGTVDASALKARGVKVSISGTGSAKVWASDTLSAEVSGVGSITYYGKPAHVSQSVSGVGSVKAAP